MANNFYYCGKLSLKSLIFRLITTYFWNTQNVPDCTILIQFFSREHTPNPSLSSGPVLRHLAESSITTTEINL